MKRTIELDEADFVSLLEAVGVAYHRRVHAGDVDGKRKFSELDQRVRAAIAEAEREQPRNPLAVAVEHAFIAFGTLGGNQLDSPHRASWELMRDALKKTDSGLVPHD